MFRKHSAWDNRKRFSAIRCYAAWIAPMRRVVETACYPEMPTPVMAQLC
jgi:hypothetical protein